MLVSVPKREVVVDQVSNRLVRFFQEFPSVGCQQSQGEGVVLRVDGPSVNEGGGYQLLEVFDVMSEIVIRVDDFLDQIKGIIL